MLKAVLQLLPGRFMDVRMRVSDGYETRVVERPGRWMQPAELEQLSADLRLVASKTLKAGSLTYGVFSGDRSRLEHSIITIVYRRSDGRPIAFNALALMEISLAGKPYEVLHLGLVMVDPDERSRGLSWILYGLTCFLMFLRNQLRPIWISNVTQVPAVVGMVAEAFSNVFPGLHAGARRSLTHVLLARQIMARHRHVFGVGPEAGFDEERFVITNAYTGGSDDLKKTFDEAAKHRDETFNAFCRNELDYGRGDDVLQIGQMSFQSARTYLADTVPRGSLAALAVAGAAATLQRLVLPVVHWADSSRQWNVLRPWRR
ncbi:hypothetical protein ACWGTO_25995 [Mesorhizobium sp. PL10]